MVSAADNELSGRNPSEPAEVMVWDVRTGARVRRSQSLEPTLARFKARLAPLSGRVDADAVAAILDRAAAEIESLDGLATEETR